MAWNTLILSSNVIIYYFKQFAAVVKPQKQIFIDKFIQNIIINRIHHSLPNRCFCYIVIIGREVDFNGNVYKANVAWKRHMSNK